MHVAHTTDVGRDPLCSCPSYSSSLYCWCHRLVFTSQTIFVFWLERFTGQRFTGPFRVRNPGSTCFFEGHEILCFLFEDLVKRFLFKRMFKISHFFQVEVWITQKTLCETCESLILELIWECWPESSKLIFLFKGIIEYALKEVFFVLSPSQ